MKIIAVRETEQVILLYPGYRQITRFHHAYTNAPKFLILALHGTKTPVWVMNSVK